MALTGALPSWQNRSLPKQNTGTFAGGGVDPAGQGGGGGVGTKMGAGATGGYFGNVNTSNKTWDMGAGAIANSITDYWGKGGGYQSPWLSPYYGDMAQIQGQLGVTQSQIPYIWQNKQLGQSQMQDQAAIDRDRIQLRHQLLGLDRGNLDYDTGYFNNLKGLLGKERGIAGQQFGLRLEQLNADANNKMRDHKSNYVASGSIFAPQTTREYANIYANLDRSRKAATFDHDRENIGFDRQGAGLDRDLFRNATDKQKLDIMGKQLGLDSKELETRLKYGLQQLGLDSDKALQQIMAQLNSLGGQGSALIMDILNKTGGQYTGSSQLGGYNPYNNGTFAG